MKDKKKGNMYGDSVKQWNVFVGCGFNCVYCEKSFKAQMKRQKPVIDKNGKKRGCQDCYTYTPHFHENRLYDKLPKTKGDEFIWVNASSDISFCKSEWMEKILKRVSELPKKTFFFQSKDPKVFAKYLFPENTLIGTTIESNRPYQSVSRAPTPQERYEVFKHINHPRKVVTIEPIMQFDLLVLVQWLKEIKPERVYIGYDTKKCGLLEPSLFATRRFILYLNSFTKVKLKYIPEK